MFNSSDYKITNTPQSLSGVAYIAEINVTEGKQGRKQILLHQNYLNELWSKTIHTNGIDKGWVLLNPKVVDTGWIDLQLVNSASSHNDLVTKGGFTSAYRTITKMELLRKCYALMLQLSNMDRLLHFYLKNSSKT